MNAMVVMHSINTQTEINIEIIIGQSQLHKIYTCDT